MKKIIYSILTVLILPLLIIAAINYYFDPDYTLRKDYISGLTRELVNNKIISGPINVNSRILKKQWIEKLPYSPEMIVLGSSRTLSLNKETFENRPFFNASVTNCTLQDMYAFINLFDKKDGPFPQEVIICVDQWLFNKNFTEKRWQQNRDDFFELLQQTSLSKKSYPSKWSFQKEWIKELFSVRYLIRSLRYHDKAIQFKVVATIDSTKMNLFPDGSRYLPEKISCPSESELHQSVENYVRTSNDEHFSVLSAQQCKLFEPLLKLLQKKQCKISLFIPPFHPLATKSYASNPKTSGLEKANKYIMQFENQENINVIDCTDSLKFQFQPDNFYDAVHLKPAVLNAIFEQTYQYPQQKKQ